MTDNTTQRSHSMDNVIGRLEAASILGVTHQTVKNWADNGIIHWGDRDSVLARMNAGKSGRRHTRYYFRDEVEALRAESPTPDLVSLDRAAEQLGITRRTVLRICERQGLPTFPGPAHITYMRQTDVDKQIPNKTYHPLTTPEDTSDD